MKCINAANAMHTYHCVVYNRTTVHVRGDLEACILCVIVNACHSVYMSVLMYEGLWDVGLCTRMLAYMYPTLDLII